MMCCEKVVYIQRYPSCLNVKKGNPAIMSAIALDIPDFFICITSFALIILSCAFNICGNDSRFPIRFR